MNYAKREILFVCDRREDGAATVREHIDQLTAHSRHRLRPLNIFGDLPKDLDLARFDGVLIHYSVMADPERLLSSSTRARLAAFAGPKAVFVQDEHRDVGRRVRLLKELGADLVFSCVPQTELSKVYSPSLLPTTKFVNVLTGFPSPTLTKMAVPAFGDRPIDVGYRARQLPAWLGQLAREKSEIARRFAGDAARYGLWCDISVAEHDRLYGPRWVGFLTSCKATLGTESGASVFDPDGSIEAAVEAHLRREPHASFETLRSKYFPELDGKVDNAQVSPRVFEASALRTMMILYPGQYSGVLVPWRHYVPLLKDHSNMHEVVAVLRDRARAEAIIDGAFREVALNPKYSAQRLSARVDAEFDEHFADGLAARPYGEYEWSRLQYEGISVQVRRAKRAARDAVIRFAFRGLGRSCSPRTADMIKGRLKQLRRRLRPPHH